MSLDTFSRTREGENMLVVVDAHLACTGMINAVESVLEAFRTMAIEHHLHVSDELWALSARLR
jgi:hypothetical protein